MTSASPSGALPAGEEPEPIVTAVVQHINGLLNVLTMLKLTKKLVRVVPALRREAGGRPWAPSP